MFRRVIIIIIFLFPLFQFSQDYSGLWKGYFSYNEIKDVTQGKNTIYAAADNAIFSLDTQTNELKEITTVNGLSGESISIIYYSIDYELLVVGYESGLIEIVFDNDTEVLTVVDIIDKPTISPGDKTINHINPYENLIYISTNYGISVFDLERLEFGDTYFIGNGGGQVPVTQTTIFEGYIYASCLENNGIRKAPVTSPSLIDYQNWELVSTGYWQSIESNEDKLYAVNNNRKIYDVIGGSSISELFSYPNLPLDLKSVNSNLIVTTSLEVYVYDSNFSIIAQIPINSDFDTQYNSATINSENIFIGTTDFGILKTPINNTLTIEEIHPDGPLLNIPFSIEAQPDGVWITYGEYDYFFNPYPLNRRGMSHLKGDSWINTRFEEVFDAKCLNTISVNPFNSNQVFISSSFNGLLEVNEEIPTILYNQTNSGVESLSLPGNPSYIDIRIVASSFDQNGLLWVMNGKIDSPLKSYNPTNNQWDSYSFKEIISNGLDDESGFGELSISNDGTKWISSNLNGFIGFNENGGSPVIRSVKTEEENMPTPFATAIAVDKRNQVWIGTLNGLRVLYNTSNFFTEEKITVDEIIIEEDGVAKELLFDQFITDIVVDGSNNKWIGTTDSGLFYFSSDGQETIFHFTTDNSPLPSNSIIDVSVDDVNGVVYIATSKGLLSFNSGSSSTFEDLSSAFAYPNPVRPGFDVVEEKVKIKDISENVNIKITDIEGNLVAEAQSRINQRHQGYNLEIDGGTAFWNGKNLRNNVVASGVYLVMLSDLDTFETKVLKLMVVR